MYYFISMIIGVLVSYLIVVNGQLAQGYGIYSSAVIVHFIGLVLSVIIYAFAKQTNKPKKKLPLYYYIGGALGVGTIVFSSIAFGKISVSAILAIGLFGQSITSIVIDQYGIFGMPKTIFAKKKFFGLAFVILGIMIMLDWFKASAMIPVVVSLLAGVTIVINRTTNARLALETSVVKSTLYNHVVGFFVAIVFMIILGRGETIFTAFRIVPNVLLYTGGLVGVLVVTLLNITVARVSSFYMTLLVFIGQVFAGIVFDTILTQSFSMTNLIGGMLVAIGLSINVWIDKWDRKTLVTISE